MTKGKFLDTKTVNLNDILGNGKLLDNIYLRLNKFKEKTISFTFRAF